VATLNTCSSGKHRSPNQTSQEQTEARRQQWGSREAEERAEKGQSLVS